MANRDVQLIIRAKNQASKTLEAVAKSLDEFSSKQDRLTSSSNDTDQAIGSLGTQFAKLNSQIEGSKAIDRMSGNLDKAATGINNLRGTVAKSEASLAEYEAEAADASAAVSTLTDRSEELTATIRKQKADLAESAKDITTVAAATRELARAEAAYQKQIARQAKDKNVDTGAAQKRLEDAQATKKTADEAAVSAQVQREAIAQTNKALIENNAALREAAKFHKNLQVAVETETQSLNTNRVALEQGEAVYGELRAKVTQAAQAFGVVADEQGRVASITPRVTMEAQRLVDVMEALARYSTRGPAGFVDASSAAQFRKVRAELEANKAAWEDLQVEIARTAKEMKATSKPTQEQIEDFSRLTRAARAAKDTNEQLQAAMHKLQETSKGFTVTQRTAADATKRLTDDQLRQGVALRELSTAIDRYRTGANSLASAPVAEGLRKQNAELIESKRRVDVLADAFEKLNNQIARGDSSASTARRFREIGAALKIAQREAKEAAAALTKLSDADRRGIFSGSINSSRTALSTFQRIRGEILGLATAYVGLYATISNVSGVISAYQKMEAAQNRLGVVFGQDGTAVRGEMQFLQAQAQRLGIEFGSLADQYTKFAVAADASNFSLGATREIFLSVAEAGRVNKLSLDDMNGVFLALQQIISKGRIGSEELRQQLGERLPGAMQIMADALGYTTAELSEMMEQGEVIANESNLLSFARELQKRFGSQLPAALKSTTTLIGKFWDNVFQAQLQVANGGFIEGFNSLLKEMNSFFQSREGRDFFLSLGAAAGKLAEGLQFVVANFATFKAAAIAVVAIKIGQWFTGLAGNMLAAIKTAKDAGASVIELAVQQKSAAVQARLLGAATAASSVSIVAFDQNLSKSYRGVGLFAQAGNLATSAVTNLGVKSLVARAGMAALTTTTAITTAGIRALSTAASLFGGPLAIVIQFLTIVGSFYLADWIGGVDAATVAMDEHSRILQAVLGDYDRLKNTTGDWADEIKTVSLDQAEKNLKNMVEIFEEMRVGNEALRASAAGISLSPFDDASDKQAREMAEAVKDLATEFAKGDITAKKYRERLEDLYKSTDSNVIKDYLSGLLDTARAMEAQAENTTIAAQIAEKFGSTLDILGGALGLAAVGLEDMAEAGEDANTVFDKGVGSVDAYSEALTKLQGKIPALAAEMKKLKDLAEIDASFAEGLAAIGGRDDAFAAEKYNTLSGARDAAITAVLSEADAATFKEIAGNTKVSQQLFADIFEEESFRSEAYDDGYGTQTIGYGSTYLDGKPVQAGQVITQEQAMRQAVNDLAKLIAGIEARVDVPLSDGQMRALVSYAYNAGIGSLERDGILQKLNAGDYGGAENAIRNGVNTSGGVYVEGLAKRRAREADLFASGADDPAVIESIYETEKKITEEKQKQSEATAKELGDLNFENESLQKKLDGKTREVFIEEGIRALREANAAITDAEIASATELLGKQFDLNAQLEVQKKTGTEIEQIEQRINDLETQRNALLEQRAIYEENGNTEKVTDIDAQVLALNTQLTTAIAQAQQMHLALGGAGADASIAKLQAMGLAIENANTSGQKMKYTATQMQESIASSLGSGIVSLVDTFASAVANGEDAIGALADGFRQFAANFLLMIAKMILEQITFNAVQQISKALTGGLGGFMGFHTGGVVGAAGNPMIQASPAWFANATRYHTGGIAGLKPGEMPAVLKVGEEVLTEKDPRHIRNGGAAKGTGSTRVVNMFDAASFLSESLSAVIGEEAILNYVRANPSAFKEAMGN